MTKKTWKDRAYEVVNNVYATPVVGTLVMISSALYTRYGPTWTRPILNALVAGALFFALTLSFRAVLSFPLAGPRIKPENVSVVVLGWLHKFRLGVLTAYEPETDFSYIVTTDGQKKITVKRHLQHQPDYLTVVGLITLTDHERVLVQKMTGDEEIEALSSIQQELLRARVGYNTTDVVSNGIVIFKHVPITHALKEKELMDAVWDVEAMVAMVLLKNAETVRRVTARLGENENQQPKRSIE